MGKGERETGKQKEKGLSVITDQKLSVVEDQGQEKGNQELQTINWESGSLL